MYIMKNLVNPILPERASVFLEPTTIHHDQQPCVDRPLRSISIDHAFLHPHRFRSDSNRLVDRFSCFVRTPKNVDEIDLLRNCVKIRICLFPKDLGLIWVHRDHSIPNAPHVSRDAV